MRWRFFLLPTRTQQGDDARLIQARQAGWPVEVPDVASSGANLEAVGTMVPMKVLMRISPMVYWSHGDPGPRLLAPMAHST